MDGVEDSNVPVLTFVPVADGTDYDDKVLAIWRNRDIWNQVRFQEQCILRRIQIW